MYRIYIKHLIQLKYVYIAVIVIELRFQHLWALAWIDTGISGEDSALKPS